jgi:hypothetical protein
MRNTAAMLLAVTILLGSANAAGAQYYPNFYWGWWYGNPTPTPWWNVNPTPTRTPTSTPQPTPTPTSASLTAPSDAFQVRYASNLNLGDSVVNITNAGSTMTGGGALSNICVDVYAFSPDEQLISCCSCTVTPNALVSLSARSDLIANTLTPAVPNSIVIKLLATAGTPCNAAVPMFGTLASGMRAWGTTLHSTPVAGTYAVTETEFSPAVLSAAELARITSFCGFIQANGSGYGICRSCRLGGQ